MNKKFINCEETIMMPSYQNINIDYSGINFQNSHIIRTRLTYTQVIDFFKKYCNLIASINQCSRTLAMASNQFEAILLNQNLEALNSQLAMNLDLFLAELESKAQQAQAQEKRELEHHAQQQAYKAQQQRQMQWTDSKYRNQQNVREHNAQQAESKRMEFQQQTDQEIRDFQNELDELENEDYKNDFDYDNNVFHDSDKQAYDDNEFNISNEEMDMHNDADTNEHETSNESETKKTNESMQNNDDLDKTTDEIQPENKENDFLDTDFKSDEVLKHDAEKPDQTTTTPNDGLELKPLDENTHTEDSLNKSEESIQQNFDKAEQLDTETNNELEEIHNYAEERTLTTTNDDDLGSAIQNKTTPTEESLDKSDKTTQHHTSGIGQLLDELDKMGTKNNKNGEERQAIETDHDKQQNITDDVNSQKIPEIKDTSINHVDTKNTDNTTNSVTNFAEDASKFVENKIDNIQTNADTIADTMNDAVEDVSEFVKETTDQVQKSTGLALGLGYSAPSTIFKTILDKANNEFDEFFNDETDETDETPKHGPRF